MRPELEILEGRITPATVCTANPVYTQECNYLDNLVTPQQATITALQSGNWSNPATWSAGRTPTASDVVYIPQGDTVTVDVTGCQALAVANNGVLTWLSTANTSLTVDTLTSGMDYAQEGVAQGEIDIGTAANPIQSGYTATLEFQRAPAATRNALFEGGNDYDSLSGGLISMGTLNIYGAQVTPYVPTTGSLAAGATRISLASSPVGWSVGDTLLIAGTSNSGANQDEQTDIAAINGSTVTLASPLQYAHAAASGTSFLVADETRNVVIESAPGTPADQQGCVMQMHNDAAGIAYADFLNLGRTDKSEPLANGSPTTGPGLNQVGRYTLHFHRCDYPGLTDNDPAIQVVGCYESGSPGWGYVNHSSNVAFTSDVAYANEGAGFATEAGNEIGSFSADYSIDAYGSPNDPAPPGQVGNFKNLSFGIDGDGYWMQSPGVSVIDCTAIECRVAFSEWNLGLNEAGLGTAMFYIPWTPDPQEFGGYRHTASGQSQNYPGYSVPITSVAISDFTGDVASYSYAGLVIDWADGTAPAGGATPVVSDFTASSVAVGVNSGSYVSSLTVQNSTFLDGIGSSSLAISSATAYAFGLTLTNLDVEGYATGAALPANTHPTNVSGGYWNNPVDFYIPHEASDGAVPQGRVITFSDLTFGPASQTDYQLAAGENENMAGKRVDGVFFPDQIILPDGSELYWPDQVGSFVPFPSGASPSYTPTQLVGLTSAQIYADFNLAPEGKLTPPGVADEPWTNGLVGAAQTPPPYFYLTSPPYAPHASPYTLKWWEASNGAILASGTYPTTFTLGLGWNAIMVTLNGQKTTFFVFGT